MDGRALFAIGQNRYDICATSHSSDEDRMECMEPVSATDELPLLFSTTPLVQ